MEDEAVYVCPTCGEEIIVPIDPHAGRAQSYVEDCPVCCSPIELRVRIEPDGEIRMDAERE